MWRVAVLRTDPATRERRGSGQTPGRARGQGVGGGKSLAIRAVHWHDHHRDQQQRPVVCVDTTRDLIVDVEPRLIVRGRGASFTLEGNLGAKGLLYTQRSQENRILPTGTLALNANLVDRWFYVDVSGLAEQIAADPYSVRRLGQQPQQDQLVPVSDQPVSATQLHAFAVADSTQRQHLDARRGKFNDADPRRNFVVNNNTLLFEQRPQPFGFSLEGKQEETRYLTGQETILKTASGRAVASYALDPTFVAGVVGGRERSEYALSTTTDVIAGFR